ncbi:hypothetical protein FGO68_gene17215 [Halteria grandinella]|uniref:Uncharacterized protein n=1 Tax=Halteria grandinella TaxID=5974 RepID=A0A8J8T938_HALGN|nr:hypothetical protein FGO68_gene17215 [Halteria grandinella]
MIKVHHSRNAQRSQELMLGICQNQGSEFKERQQRQELSIHPISEGTKAQICSIALEWHSFYEQIQMPYDTTTERAREMSESH